MNSKKNACLALTVLAAGLMIGGLAPTAMADPSAPPSNGRTKASTPDTTTEPCSALRASIDMNNTLTRPVLMRVPYVVRVPVTDTSTQALLVGLGGATALGGGIIAVRLRNRRQESL